MNKGRCKCCNKIVTVTGTENLVVHHQAPRDRFRTCPGSMNEPIQGSVHDDENDDNK